MSPSASQPKEWLTFGRFAILLASFIFLAFPHVLTGSQSFIFRDYGLFGYPLAHYHRECFWQGEVPLWNPYNNFGLPFLAQWNTMVLYPPTLIYLLLPLPWSLSFFTLLHLFFGGLGMYKLASRWTGHPLASAVAGVAFVFNGFTQNCLIWPNHTASLAWMPWVILAVTRAWSEGGRAVIVASFCGALQMLSGAPEMILFTWVMLGGLWLCSHFPTVRAAWTMAWRFALVVLLVAGLAAAQLFPFLQLVPHTQRDANYEVGQWSFQPWGWANFFVPLFRHFPTESGVYFQPDQLLTSSYYPGLLAVLFALAALCWVRDRRVRFLILLIAGAMVLGMGDRAYVYSWVRKAFPEVGLMRYTVKFVILLTIAWPLLAAFGIAALWRHWNEAGDKARLRQVTVLGVIIAATAAGIGCYAYFVPAVQEDGRATLQNAGLRVAFLMAAIAALWALHRSLETKQRSFLQVLFLVILFCDMFKHVPQQNPTAEREVFDVKLSSLEQMNPRPTLGVSRAMITLDAHSAFRHTATTNLTIGYLGLRAGLYANVNLMSRIPKTDGFYALYFGPERDIHFRLFQGDDRPRPELARFLGVSQITSSTNVVAWTPLTNFMPLVTAGQAPEFHTRAATLVRMITASFQPERIVYLPIEARQEITVTNGGGARVLSTWVRPDRVEAEVEATAPSMVVVSQSYYHCWKAFIDGQPVKIWRANHGFQALQVSAGKHRVELVYRDGGFMAGAILSATVFLVLAALWVRSRICAGPASIRDRKPAAPVLAEPIVAAISHETTTPAIWHIRC